MFGVFFVLRRYLPLIPQIWNHPDVLYEALQKENLASDQDLDLDDLSSTGPARCQTTANQKSKTLETPVPAGGLSLNQLQEKANQVISYEWVRNYWRSIKGLFTTAKVSDYICVDLLLLFLEKSCGNSLGTFIFNPWFSLLNRQRT